MYHVECVPSGGKLAPSHSAGSVIAVSADKEEDNEEDNEQDKRTITIAR